MYDFQTAVDVDLCKDSQIYFAIRMTLNGWDTELHLCASKYKDHLEALNGESPFNKLALHGLALLLKQSMEEFGEGYSDEDSIQDIMEMVSTAKDNFEECYHELIKDL